MAAKQIWGTVSNPIIWNDSILLWRFDSTCWREECDNLGSDYQFAIRLKRKKMNYNDQILSIPHEILKYQE